MVTPPSLGMIQLMETFDSKAPLCHSVPIPPASVILRKLQENTSFGASCHRSPVDSYTRSFHCSFANEDLLLLPGFPLLP